MVQISVVDNIQINPSHYIKNHTYIFAINGIMLDYIGL